MPDREKVIKGLEQFIADFKPFCGNEADWKRVFDAIALLKTQEPVRPMKKLVYHVRKGPVVFSYVCPVCMRGLQRHWVACPICGKAVKWI